MLCFNVLRGKVLEATVWYYWPFSPWGFARQSGGADALQCCTAFPMVAAASAGAVFTRATPPCWRPPHVGAVFTRSTPPCWRPPPLVHEPLHSYFYSFPATILRVFMVKNRKSWGLTHFHSRLLHRLRLTVVQLDTVNSAKQVSVTFCYFLAILFCLVLFINLVVADFVVLIFF
jgi:hypothetical protein